MSGAEGAQLFSLETRRKEPDLLLGCQRVAVIVGRPLEQLQVCRVLDEDPIRQIGTRTEDRI